MLLTPARLRARTHARTGACGTSPPPPPHVTHARRGGLIIRAAPIPPQHHAGHPPIEANPCTVCKLHPIAALSCSIGLSNRVPTLNEKATSEGHKRGRAVNEATPRKGRKEEGKCRIGFRRSAVKAASEAAP